jgi:hypothetical protein
MPHFFISHSDSERRTAHGLADFLRSQGFDIWINDGRVPATITFLKEVEDAIRRSKFLIVIWSTAAAKSRWVRLEIDIARSFNKRIIPLVIGEDREFKMLSDGGTIRLSDPQGLAELKQLFTAPLRPSEIIDPPGLQDRRSVIPARKSKWPIFLSGVVIGFLGFLGVWFWLAR